MIPQPVVRAMVNKLQTFPEVSGAIIGLETNNQSSLAFPGATPSLNFGRVALILEEAQGSGVSVSASFAQDKPEVVASSPASPPAITTNGSRVAAELFGAGLSCTMTLVSAVGVVGSLGAEAPSAGASTFVLVMSWAGLVASTAQCSNGVIRFIEARRHPDSNSLQLLDEDKVLSIASLIVDAIGVATSVASIGMATKKLLTMLQVRGGLVASEQLVTMTRAQRIETIQAAVRRASATPEGRAALEQALIEQGFSKSNAAKIAAGQTVEIGSNSANALGRMRFADKAIRAISKQTAERIASALKDIAINVVGVAASGSKPEFVGSASGVVNVVLNIILHIIQQPDPQ
jgi:hypothetical protein